MLYYLINTDDRVQIKAIENATDGTYFNLKRDGLNVVGVFGRGDYADIWCKFHNKEINREQLNNYLNRF